MYRTARQYEPMSFEKIRNELLYGHPQEIHPAFKNHPCSEKALSHLWTETIRGTKTNDLSFARERKSSDLDKNQHADISVFSQKKCQSR